jgi:hypothetical protein
MSELNGDFLVADEKIGEGLDWSDTMTIPVAGEQLEFGFSLLNERVLQRVQNELPLDEFRDYKRDGMSEEHERLMELQRKDELTENERDELLELVEEVNPEEEGKDALSDGAINALMDAGKAALEPTEGDVQDIMAADPETQRRIFDEVPQFTDRSEARDRLREYMKGRVEEQPFPLKFTLGQRAYMETVSVQGNGFQNTST